MVKSLSVRTFDIDFTRSGVVLHKEDADDLGVRTSSRVKIISKRGARSAVLNTSEKFIKSGEIGIFDKVAKELKVQNGDRVSVHAIEKPESVAFIKKKLMGETLDVSQINRIIHDMVSENMSDIEISAWVCSLQASGMNMDEVVNLTKAMAESGKKLEFEGTIYDKHSIGGVPGNKITPLVVPIVASCGLKIPKTSSRAITSPSGTADVIEVFCRVDLSVDEIEEVVEKTNGCMVWGGGVNLAPADDMTIQAEYPLDLDPRPLLLASVMSKKKAVNANYCVIDIPVGRQTKVETIGEGEKLARDFIELGSRLDIQVECALTYGSQPIGYAIGPALEAREALVALRTGEGPRSLIEKSCAIAGVLLEIGGVAPNNKGMEYASEVLKSGKAYAKFKEIVEAQGGNPEIKPEDIALGREKIEIIAQEEGYVSKVENHGIKLIAKAAGAPKDKEAGILLSKKIGKKVDIGDVLFTIYSNNSEKLQQAQTLANTLQPVKIESMVLEKIHPHIRVR